MKNNKRAQNKRKLNVFGLISPVCLSFNVLCQSGGNRQSQSSSSSVHCEVEGSQFTNKYKDRVARHQCSDPAPGGRPCGVSRVLRKPDLYIVVTGSVVV